MAVCYGQDLNGRIFFTIDDREGESPQDKSPSLVVGFRPAARRVKHKCHCLFDVSYEILGRTLAALDVPSYS